MIDPLSFLSFIDVVIGQEFLLFPFYFIGLVISDGSATLVVFFFNFGGAYSTTGAPSPFIENEKKY